MKGSSTRRCCNPPMRRGRRAKGAIPGPSPPSCPTRPPEATCGRNRRNGSGCKEGSANEWQDGAPPGPADEPGQGHRLPLPQSYPADRIRVHALFQCCGKRRTRNNETVAEDRGGIATGGLASNCQSSRIPPTTVPAARVSFCDKGVSFPTTPGGFDRRAVSGQRRLPWSPPIPFLPRPGPASEPPSRADVEPGSPSPR